MRSYLLILLIIGCNILLAQNPTKNWTIQPYTNLGFTENIGRYDSILGEEVQYFAEIGTYKAFFSANSFVIGKPKELTPEEAHERREKEEKGQPIQPISWEYFKIKFSGSNVLSEIQPIEIKTHYRFFQNSSDSVHFIKARSYNKLIYKNLYKNIDVIFETPEEGGLKYSFIVNPGGDYSQIKMIYSNIKLEKDHSGGLLLKNPFAFFKDHKPVSFVDGKIVPSEFICDSNTVGFEIDAYNLSKTLIIDPWLVEGIPAGPKVLEVSSDDVGNCVVAVFSTPPNEEVLYYNNLGVLLWTWTSPSDTDLSMNPITGETYVTSAVPTLITRLDNSGLVSGANTMSAGGSQEVLRVRYNAVSNQVITGDGGIDGGDDQITILNSGLTTFNEYEPLTDPMTWMEDCVLLEVDPFDGSIYFLPSAVDEYDMPFDIYENQLFKLNVADPTSIIWSTETGHRFVELFNVTYLPTRNGVNGITCGEMYVYTYDGKRLYQYDKATGTETAALIFDTDQRAQYGIDLDDCGNVYIGSENSILVLNEALIEIGSYAIPGNCYDLVIQNGYLTACGEDFIIRIELEVSDFTVNATPTSCGSCSGTATITTESCDELTFESVVWSPGGETETTISDLCPGWYIATVTWENVSGEEIILIDSVEVIITGDGITVEEETINETCLDLCDGKINLTPTSGEAPYTYSIDGCSTSSASGLFEDLCPGTYEVCVEDVNGCQYSNTVVILAGGSDDVSFIPFGPLCLNDAEVSLSTTMPGGIYSGDGVIGSVFDPAIAGIGTHTITYTLEGDCPVAITYDVTVLEIPSVEFTANPKTGCEPLLVEFENMGDIGVDCLWNYGDGLSTVCGSFSHTYYSSGIYDVSLTITDINGCSNTLLKESYIEVYPTPIANFDIEPNTEITPETEVHFLDLSTDATSWTWTFNDLDESNEQEPNYVFSNGIGEYEVVLMVENIYGCINETSKTVLVSESLIFYIPNVITPDGNLFNEVFKPYFTGIDVYDYSLQVYNRWGELLFESYNVDIGWNGTYGGAIVQDGVYVWKINVKESNSDRKNSYTGYVSVIK